jgi:hypothetical protein
MEKKIEIKTREISKNWGFALVYDVYADGVRVAVVDGGHVDLKSPSRLLSVSWDNEGNPIYNASDGNYTTPFNMSEAVKDLIKKGEEVKLFYIKEFGSKEKEGPFLTWNEAANKVTSRWQKVVELDYNVTRDGKLVQY